MIKPTTPAERLRAVGKLGPYPEATPEGPMVPPADAGQERAERVDTAAVRVWATANGIGLRDRGPIPAAVLEQYLAREN